MMNKNLKRIVSHYLKNEQSTQVFARLLADYCQPPLFISLSGDLGSGKTTFVRALLRELGVLGLIKSPTYSLVESYQLDEKKIFHFDLYRLQDPEELELMGWRDYLSEKAIWLIEWPEKAASYLPIIDLKFHLSDYNHGRKLEIKVGSEKGDKILSQVSQQIQLM